MEVIALILVIAGWIAAPMIVAFVVLETRNGGLRRSAWRVMGLGVLLSAIPLLFIVFATGGRYANWTDAAVLWPLTFSVATAFVALGCRLNAIARSAVKRRKEHAV